MQNIRKLLLTKAQVSDAPLWVVEKDYALSYLLAGIAKIPSLDALLILKGGTALKKAYFKEYRFSEDLDFTTVRLGPIDNIDDIMQTAIANTALILQEKGAFEVSVERLVLREPHPGDQVAFTVRVQFPYQRSPLCRLKVEITVDEPLLLNPVERIILHDFDERFDATILVYPPAEIVAEKLRALLQSRLRLQLRGWGASRVCRDYYDLWYILTEVDLSSDNIPELVSKKCQLRGTPFNSPMDFFSDELLETATAEWQRQLTPFVAGSPDVDKLLSDLRGHIDALWV